MAYTIMQSFDVFIHEPSMELGANSVIDEMLLLGNDGVREQVKVVCTN